MRRSTIDPENAVVVVTGAAGGIGSSAAHALHARGARVVLVDLSQDDVDAVAARLGSTNALAMAADVTDKAAMDDVFAATQHEFGRVDAVFANAGISSGNRAYTVGSAPDGIFERVIAVNLGGVWNTVRAGLPMILESGGHILVTSSTYAYLNGAVNAPYAASKAAVEQLGRSLRVELAAHGATAGVLYPGWVATPIAEVAFGADSLATELVAHAFPRPLHRPVSPALVGRAVVRGIERRSASIQVPKRWIPMSALRGLINPVFDRSLAGDETLRDLIRQVERRTAHQ